MSKTVEYRCNVCGKLLKGTDDRTVKNESALLRLWAPTEARAGAGQRFDLCLEHFDAFVAFLETGRVKEEGDV